MVDQNNEAHVVQTTPKAEPNDIIRQILTRTLIELLPVLIERYLTNEVIEKLIKRGLSRIDEV